MRSTNIWRPSFSTASMNNESEASRFQRLLGQSAYMFSVWLQSNGLGFVKMCCCFDLNPQRPRNFWHWGWLQRMIELNLLMKGLYHFDISILCSKPQRQRRCFGAKFECHGTTVMCFSIVYSVHFDERFCCSLCSLSKRVVTTEEEKIFY